ncbi:MAG: hypothetical protein J5999_09260 [Oscillospiraceae bacterium]|nr:hypothetical protein [Oscillospiraceae bacterium]
MSMVQILIGDDSIEYGRQIQRYMTDNYLPSEICPHLGTAVIEAAKRLSPKILICDEILRDMTVYDIIDAVRTDSTAKPYVIITTPCPDSNVRSKIRQLRNVSLFMKPYDLDILFDHCLKILNNNLQISPLQM